MAAAPAKGPQPSVGFLLTEVDGQAPEEASPYPGAGILASPAASSSPSLRLPAPSDRAKAESTAALPMVSVYTVEDSELPIEALSDTTAFAPAPLPATIPFDKLMTNVVQNLDVKSISDNARNMWFKEFKSPASKAVISDTFWFCICWYFKAGRHPDVEKRLFDRISANFVFLFEAVAQGRKDFFFKNYADASAQAVLYAMFLAYPKSRVSFTDKFRRELVTRISFWTTGICPEFVDTSHWKLNLGGGDVLQATTSPAWQRSLADGQGAASSAPSAGPGGSFALTAAGGAGGSSLALAGAPGAGVGAGVGVGYGPPGFGPGAAGGGAGSAAHSGMGQISADNIVGRRASLAHRAPRPLQTLRYSPLVNHFLKTRKFSSVNLVRATRMGLTSAEERSKLMDVKHTMLAERATMAREHCERLNNEYNELCSEVKRQERQRQAQAQTAKKRLEIRRKEVLRSDPHEYANYLVSLHLLQQGAGQGA